MVHASVTLAGDLPILGDMGVETTPDGRLVVTDETVVTFSAVQLTPSLFRRGTSTVAMYAPEEATAHEVTAVARHVFGDVQPIARG
jgi:hypothetical protein